MHRSVKIFGIQLALVFTLIMLMKCITDEGPPSIERDPDRMTMPHLPDGAE
jgi:hypothetical protein